MSDPILPLLQWPSGIQQASVPANENALRLEALFRPALGVANDEISPVDGDVWIVGDTPAGAFLNFDPDDIALYHVDEVSGVGGWHAWAPVEDVRLVVNGDRLVWTGSSGWITDPSITGGGSGSVTSVNGQTGVVELDAEDVGAVSGLVAGSGISIDDTDPQNPIVSSTGTGTGTVESIVAGAGISVDDTDPANPIVSATGGGGSDVVDVITPSNSSGTVTLNFASKSKYVGAITLSANVTTLAFSNLPGSGKYAEYELHITQDGTGSHTFAIPASHKALGGSDTAIASAANAVTVLTASTVNNGTTWRYAMQESA